MRFNSRFRIFLSAGFIMAAMASSLGESPPAIHFAPRENLERIDVALIDQAKSDNDLAAYVLTDWPVMQALTRAARRGVKVRIYLDSGRFLTREPSQAFFDLINDPAIEIRFKRPHAPLMHLKAYQIDGRLLRSGSANFSASGLKRQDNDLIIMENPTAAMEFERNFDTIFARSETFAADQPGRRR